MRKKNSLGTRLLALLLSALLVLGAVPVNRASATENEAETIFSFEDAEPKEIQYKEGLEYTNCASGGEGNGAITYEILSGTEIATINSETGTLTISGPGTVTVQAKKAEDGEVPVQIAKYTLRIVQPEKEPFAFETKEPENLVYAEDLTYRNAASGGDGDGAVSYALLVMPTEEDEDEETEPEPLETDRNEVATIDTETGTVTILQAGSITVRAKKASDGDIPEQYAQYVLQIDLAEQTGFGFEDPAPDALEYKEGLTFTNTASGGEGTGAVTYAITEGDEV
ncbi:MAG: cadherin repeat domain-containing protein, partial [Faecousia sp.]